MSAAMTDIELIGYCEIHCTTERALFAAEHVNRMIELAGDPPGFKRQNGWVSARGEMQELCDLARASLAPPAAAIAPPVAAGSVDTLQRYELEEKQYGSGYMASYDKHMEEDADGEYVLHADAIAWGAQQREMGRQERGHDVCRDSERFYRQSAKDAIESAEKAEEGLAQLQYERDNLQKLAISRREWAEKAEADLAAERVRVQDYYTRWRCERENPTNTHRLDTWQAACGQARAERDKVEFLLADALDTNACNVALLAKAEARVKELQEEIADLQLEMQDERQRNWE